MATIRHTLQREVLNPAEERLLAVCHVNKVLKKKKSSFLCLVVSCVTPITVSIHQVNYDNKITSFLYSDFYILVNNVY